MAVVIETTLGDITVDLFVKQRPTTCLNFLKLCKMKYYNFNLFHTIQSGFIAQTGDPTGVGTGGHSIFGLIEGPEKRFFSGEKMPKIRHADAGLLSMVSTGDSMIGSQFFFTLGPDLDSLDGVHCVIGSVTEGQDVLRKLNDVICDETHRPYQDVRITHTVVLEDPFSDPIGMTAPSRSPSPSAERLKGGRIAPDEELDETQGKSTQEIQEIIEEKEAKARATILEIVGDLPDADVAPPENVLFVCKLNPVTTDEDLEIIFSRFGTIVGCEVIRDKKTGDSLQYAFIEFDDKKSCEDAYFKMDNVLIDDRRIHVDFSQSVSKMRWLGKGKGIRHFDGNGKEESNRSDKNYSYRNSRTDQKDYSRNERISDNRSERKSYYRDDKRSDRRVDKRTEHRDDRKSDYRQERKSDNKHIDSKSERRLGHSERDRSLDTKKSRNSPSKDNNKIKCKTIDNSKREKSPSKYDKNHDGNKDRFNRNSSLFRDYESKKYDRSSDRRDRHEKVSTKNKSPESNNPVKVYDKENCKLDVSRKSKDTNSKNGNENEKATASKMTLERFVKKNRNDEVEIKYKSQDKKADNKHNKEIKNKSNSHKNTEVKDEKINDKKDNKLAKKKKNTKIDSSTFTKKNSKLTDKTKDKSHVKKVKKRRRESSSNSSSDSSTDSSSSSSDTSYSSSDAKNKRKIKRKHSTSTSSSTSDSSTSSSSDTSSDSSSSSSDSDEPKKKKKKGSLKPSQKLKKK